MCARQTARHRVTVSGCDDETEIVVALTIEEADVVARIAALITAASDYGCQPRMKIAMVRNEE